MLRSLAKAGLVLATLMATASVAQGRPALEKPNIVMFFVDDLGYGDLGFTGNPSVHTPNIDRLAAGGKILNAWYSGCPVCSGSRAALMTGRQYTRVGVPGVFGDSGPNGLPLNETTVADQLKQAGYATAIMGKWHLGQRPMFLPGARGFDTYMGIPYSDDMGQARRSKCPSQDQCDDSPSYVHIPASSYKYTLHDNVHGTADNLEDLNNAGVQDLTPLVFQSGGTTSNNGYPKNTTILEQPLDFTTLPDKYNDFVLDFIDRSQEDPFFLYMPFSHVHTTASNQPQAQYASCRHQNFTARGAFGDALADVDWVIGNVVAKLEEANVMENTLILFTSDNGPWMTRGLSAGSTGIYNGRYSGYWNTGKGSTWDGGIHEAAFAHWKGQIAPNSRSLEVVSSLDLLPTASALAGVPLPTDRVYDGRDMSNVLLQEGGQSLHDVLFFYGGATPIVAATGYRSGPSAARMGCWKAHWATGPGIGGCSLGAGQSGNCPDVMYPLNDPLIFNVCIDPSEGIPLAGQDSGVVRTRKAPYPKFNNSYPGANLYPGDTPVAPAAILAAQAKFVAAYKTELATFTWGKLVAPDLLPGEVNATLALCCDKNPFHAPPTNYSCDCDGPAYSGSNGPYPSWPASS